MCKTILLSDLLRLIPSNTEIVLRDEYYSLLHRGMVHDEDTYKYEDKLVLELDVWDDTTLYVRVVNENY